MKPYFSVIVPVYNIEPYLHSCIKSILNQTFQSFELILVDDGSVDACPAICDEYAEKDERVKVIHKENGGLVSARQAGLVSSGGKYIVNVDGDDWIDRTMLEDAHRIIEDYHVDIVTFSFFYAHDTYRMRAAEPVKSGFYGKREMEKIIYPRILMDASAEHMQYFLWGKAIRRELLIKHEMKVPKEVTYGEDLLCILPVYLEAQSVFVCDKSVYFYRQRETSMVRKKYAERDGCELKLLELLEMRGAENAEDFEQQLDRYGMMICFWNLQAAANKGDFKAVSELQEYFKNPLFQKHIQKATFGKITPKLKLETMLIRKNWILGGFICLRLIEMVKKIIGKKNQV